MLESGATAVLMFETLSLWNTQEADQDSAQGSASRNTKCFLKIIFIYDTKKIKVAMGKSETSCNF